MGTQVIYGDKVKPGSSPGSAGAPQGWGGGGGGRVCVYVCVLINEAQFVVYLPYTPSFLPAFARSDSGQGQVPRQFI